MLQIIFRNGANTVQLNAPPPPQESSLSDQTSLLEETRPPDPTLSLTSDEQPSVSLTPDSSHSISLPQLVQCEDPEDEDEGEEEGIPEHEFEIKTTEGKFGKMKGVARENVSLLLGNLESKGGHLGARTSQSHPVLSQTILVHHLQRLESREQEEVAGEGENKNKNKPDTSRGRGRGRGRGMSLSQALNLSLRASR